MSEITCPYCDEDFELIQDDGQHYRDGESQEDQCPHCDKYIMVYASVSWSHEAEKADCLNGSPHDFTEWRRMWDGEEKHLGETLERRTCNDCNEVEQEWHKKDSTSA